MPITAANIVSSVLSVSGGLFSGANWVNVVSSIAAAINVWVYDGVSVKLVGVTTGAPGPGTVQGALLIPPNVAVLYSQLTLSGLVGPQAFPLANVLAQGLSLAFSGASYVGPSVGVAVGTDASAVVALPSVLQAQLSGYFLGASGSTVSFALANGISALFSSGSGVGSVVGTPVGPGVSAGTSPQSFLI